MTRSLLRMLAASTLLGAVACSKTDMNGPDGDAFSILGSAFNTAPVGMDNTATSYAGAGDGMPWEGPAFGFGRGMSVMGGREMMGGPGTSGLMGGGLEASYSGEMAQGRGAHHGPFGGDRGGPGGPGGFGGFGGAPIDASCAVSTNVNVTCTTTRSGLTIKTVYVIRDKAGAWQARIDSATTNQVSSTTTVTGTTTRGRNGEVTATVNNTSTRSVTGLAPGAAERTVNGTSTGTETSSGTDRDGKKFTAKRDASDKTENLVIPNGSSTQSYPKSGKVTRTMTVTATVDGTTTTKKRTETLTYDGSATAKLVIDDNGTIKTCTLALPRGKPSCS